MPKNVCVEPHLSSAKLYSRYRASTDSVERSHYQIIWLLADGKTPASVSQVTGYSRRWVYQLLRRYNQHGSDQNARLSPIILQKISMSWRIY